MSSMVWICRPCAAPTMSVPRSFGRPQTSTTRTAILIPHARGDDEVAKKVFWSILEKSFCLGSWSSVGERPMSSTPGMRSYGSWSTDERAFAEVTLQARLQIRDQWGIGRSLAHCMSLQKNTIFISFFISLFRVALVMIWSCVIRVGWGLTYCTRKERLRALNIIKISLLHQSSW